MSNEEQKTITINLYLIGDEGVGKKSFVSRLNTMACSFSHPNKNKIKPPKEEKKKKKMKMKKKIQMNQERKKNLFTCLHHHQIN